jgi:hypothetical protein
MKNDSVWVASIGILFIRSFVKLGQLVRKLKWVRARGNFMSQVFVYFLVMNVGCPSVTTFIPSFVEFGYLKVLR